MGMFDGKKKKESISLSDAEELLGNPRALRGMTKAEIKDLQRRAAGKTSFIKDVMAANNDAKNGRKGGGVGKMPKGPVDENGNPRKSWR